MTEAAVVLLLVVVVQAVQRLALYERAYGLTMLRVWAIAICMLLAWMLLANNAIQRLIRMNDELRREAQREAAGSTERTDVSRE